MTDNELLTEYQQVKHSLDALKTAALEPVNTLDVIAASGRLAINVGHFINACTLRAYKQMVRSGDDTVNR